MSLLEFMLGSVFINLVACTHIHTHMNANTHINKCKYEFHTHPILKVQIILLKESKIVILWGSFILKKA